MKLQFFGGDVQRVCFGTTNTLSDRRIYSERNPRSVTDRSREIAKGKKKKKKKKALSCVEIYKMTIKNIVR